MHAAPSPSSRAGFLALLGLLPALLPAKSRDDPRYPSTIDTDKGPRVFSLEPGEGFQPLRNEVTYVIDPRLADPAGGCYQPASEFDRLGLTEAAAGGSPRIVLYVQDTVEDFFNLATGADADRVESLQRLLADNPTPRSQALIAVSARFEIDPEGKSLSAALEIRAFKLVIERVVAGRRERGKAVHCELIFQDRATGTVPLTACSGDPERLVRAAVIQALKDQIAVNLYLHRAARDALDSAHDRSRLKAGGVLGLPLCPSERPADATP